MTSPDQMTAPAAASETVTKVKPKDMRPRLSAKVPKTAMVLCAGLGTRMRPLSDDRPKPLVDVWGKPLLEHTFDRLRRVGVERVVLNAHHKAKSLEKFVNARNHGLEILISDERKKLLDTGGGVAKALPFLGNKPFYVINGDVIWRNGLNNTLMHLASRWNSKSMDALLLIVETVRAVGYDGMGDFDMNTGGLLSRRAERQVTPYIHGGVQILDPRLFKGFKKKSFSLNEIYDRAIKKNRLYGLIHEGPWAHVGTPEAVRAAEQALFE